MEWVLADVGGNLASMRRWHPRPVIADTPVLVVLPRGKIWNGDLPKESYHVARIKPRKIIGRGWRDLAQKEGDVARDGRGLHAILLIEASASCTLERRLAPLHFAGRVQRVVEILDWQRSLWRVDELWARAIRLSNRGAGAVQHGPSLLNRGHDVLGAQLSRR